MSNTAPVHLCWSANELGHGLFALARAAGLHPHGLPTTELCADTTSFLQQAADRAQLDLVPTDCTFSELPEALARCGPALVRVPAERGDRYLAIVGARGRTVQVLAPTLCIERLRTREVAAWISAQIEQPAQRRIERFLHTLDIADRSAERASQALLRQLLGERRVGQLWLLRADPGASFWAQLRARGITRRLWAFGAAAATQVAVGMYGWTLLARSALAGVAERDWLLAWTLCCLSAIPLQAFLALCGGQLLIDVAALIKQRLLCGALRASPDAIRARGTGRLLAMVSESEAIEGPGLSAAFGAALALLQLVAAGVVLGFGAGGWLHLTSVALWTLLFAGLWRRYYGERVAWTRERSSLARAFVENVLGNRTRVVQQAEERWHVHEDQRLQRFGRLSERMDLAHRQLCVLPARGWLAIAWLGLIPALAADAPLPALAIALGGTLQAYSAFAGLAANATLLSSAVIAFRHIADLFDAAADRPLPPIAATEVARGALRPGDVVLDVRGLSYRYPQAARPAVHACSLQLRMGERVLLEGASGGGKSTLAALVLGMRQAQAGHILLRGLDRATLGAHAWRQRVASAPQFHENHLLSASLAFNLLMGRAWPPSDADRQEAEKLCQQLGLGPTLARMPARLDQVVGESGWQLSHGERSRVFLARALLQQAEVIVLDETFGALDPSTLRACVDSVLSRAPVLLVIAHP